MRFVKSGLALCVLFLPLLAVGQEGGGMQLNLSIGGEVEGDQNWAMAIRLVVLMTMLSFAPAAIMLMTSFTRIVIVLGFVRNAMGTQQTPSNQIIIGLALIMTFFIMQPVIQKIMVDAVDPYQAGEITFQQALANGSEHMKDFMISQTKKTDLEYFLALAQMGPTTRDELPLRVVIPSFVLSELRTAFQMGFLLFLPFIVVDFLVASILMAMGMMMMPPVVISMPFKILLFVLVDGWYLIVSSLVESFRL